MPEITTRYGDTYRDAGVAMRYVSRYFVDAQTIIDYQAEIKEA